METVALPTAFTEFAPLIAKWAYPTENQRSDVRWTATAAEFAELYCAVMPRLPEIMEILARYPVSSIPPEVQPLYWLTCAFAEAAPHHELYKGSNVVPHSFDARRFRAVHGDTSD